MSTIVEQWVIGLYLAGFVISVAHSVKSFIYFKRLKNQQAINLLTGNIERHLLFRPIFWPVFFVLEKDPLTCLSEVMFKHYGDPGHVYQGNRGLINFLNDVIKGKSRYQDFVAKRVVAMANPSQEVQIIYQETDPTYVEILYGRYKKKYLLQVVYGAEDELSNHGNISRFELDNCERLNEVDFKKRIAALNTEKSSEILSILIDNHYEEDHPLNPR